MKYLTLPLQSRAVLTVAAYPHLRGILTGLSLHARRDTDAQTIASYARQGLCMSYTGKKNRTSELASCNTYCSAQNDSDASGCQGPTTTFTDTSILYKDDSGLEYTPGTCFCNGRLATLLAKEIADALTQLDDVICAVMVDSIEAVIQIGLDLAPNAWGEKAMAKGFIKVGLEAAAKLAVKEAKSYKVNACSTTDMFKAYTGKKCKMPIYSFDMNGVFGKLVGASDDWVTSISIVQEDDAKSNAHGRLPV